MRSLLLAAVAAVAGVTLLRGEAPSPARSARPAAAVPEPTDEEIAAGEAVARERAPRVLDDATGAPVADARVAFHRGAAEVGDDRTDGAGAFAVPDALFDTLVVRADGYPPAAFPREASVLRLRRGEWRQLSILDEDGRPGIGAVVEVYADYRSEILLATAAADARGVAVIRLVGGEWMFVRFPGCAYADVHGDRVMLSPAFTLGGQVVDTAGRPVAGARVRVWQGGG